MARTARQRAAQLKAAKASALARKKRALVGQSRYKAPNDQSGTGTARHLTNENFNRLGSTNQPGLAKPKLGKKATVKADPVISQNLAMRSFRQAATKSDIKRNKHLFGMKAK